MFFVAFGSFISKFLTFLFVPLYTSILTTEEYGQIDIIFITFNLLYPFFTFAIYESTLRLLLDNNEDKKVIILSNFLVNLFGFILLLITCVITSFIYKNNTLIFLLVVYYVSHIFYINLSSIVRGLDRLDIFAFSSVINSTLIIIFNILFLLLFKWGVKGYVFAYSFSFLISSFYMLIKTKIYNYLTLNNFCQSINLTKLKEMLRYSLPLIPNQMAWWISNSSNKYILTYFHGMSATGLYSVADKIPSFISTVSRIFTTAWQISSVEDFGSKQSKDFFCDIYYKYTSLLLLVVSLVVLFVKVIAFILFKKDFYTAWIYAAVLVSAAMVYGLASFIGTIFTGAKYTKPLFYSTLSGSVMNIVLNLCFIPKWGGLAAAISVIVSYLIVFIMRLLLSRKLLKFKIDYKSDIICFTILAIQIIITVVEWQQWIIMSIVCFLFIIVLRRKFVVWAYYAGTRYLENLIKKVS